jgi:hypothetical protein
MVTSYEACGVVTRMEDTVFLSYRSHFARFSTALRAALDASRENKGRLLRFATE